VNKTYKALKKIIIFTVGAAVFIVGVALLVLPGPGLLTMAAGLVILSSEFEWAERHLASIKQKIRSKYEEAKNKRKDGKKEE